MNSLTEDTVSIQLDNGEAGAVIIQVANTVSKDHLVGDGESTHVGMSMIEALMPPKGAHIKVEQDENNYRVFFTLSDPVVHYIQPGDVISNNKLAS